MCGMIGWIIGKFLYYRVNFMYYLEYCKLIFLCLFVGN